MTHKENYFGLQDIDENNTASEVDINLVVEQLKRKYLESVPPAQGGTKPISNKNSRIPF